MRIGTYIPEGRQGDLAVICQDPALARHIRTPWMRAYIAQRLGITLPASAKSARRCATIPDTNFDKHCLLAGAIGSGKTAALKYLLGEQLHQGASVACLLPKPDDTPSYLLHQAQQCGLTLEQITIISARLSATPGCPLFQKDVSQAQSVGDFVSLLRRLHSSWGPRMDDLLVNILIIVAAHGLSLYEAARLLVRDDYREALLRLPVKTSDRMAYQEAVAFFRDEFSAWSKSERAQAVGPILNKIREILRNEPLFALWCSRSQDLDIPALWQRQHLLIAECDPASWGSDEGAKLLVGWLCSHLYRAALRCPGPVPVVLALDELPVIERFVGSTLADIVTVARSLRLRLVVACQHLAQLSESLATALLANCGTSLFFRLGDAADARLAASCLAAHTRPSISRAVVSLEPSAKKTGVAAQATWRHSVYDPGGRPLRLDPAVWQKLYMDDLFGKGSVDALYRLARACAIERLYVRSADTQKPVELRQYLAGLSPSEYWIDSCAPVTLTVAFPRPRLSGVERTTHSDALEHWSSVLESLPVQHALLRTLSEPPGIVRIVDVADPPSDPSQIAFLKAVLGREHCNQEDAQALLRWRSTQIERLAQGYSDEQDFDEDDGSLA